MANQLGVNERVRLGLLKPNVSYDCEVCGKHVEKYVSPSDQPKNALQYCSRKCKGVGQRGDKHPMWNGGRRVNEQGYIEIYNPNHPYASNRGAVREHRIVMEKILGRYLLPEEVVHHKNGDRSDNRPENLQLFANNAEHKAFDIKEREIDSAGRLLKKGGVANV